MLVTSVFQGCTRASSVLEGEESATADFRNDTDFEELPTVFGILKTTESSFVPDGESENATASEVNTPSVDDERSGEPEETDAGGLGTIALVGIIVGIIVAVGILAGIIIAVVRKMSGRYSNTILNILYYEIEKKDTEQKLTLVNLLDHSDILVTLLLKSVKWELWESHLGQDLEPKYLKLTRFVIKSDHVKRCGMEGMMIFGKREEKRVHVIKGVSLLYLFRAQQEFKMNQSSKLDMHFNPQELVTGQGGMESRFSLALGKEGWEAMNTSESPVAVETLDDVPEHVLRGLPEDVRLFPSAVDKSRLGVWATKSILKGKKFGPFVGDKKKRSQVKSNVYMWEVYYPNLGWMCVDATDPEKGNWLRYINWARSGKEQNLFPLEINRTIYYKSLKCWEYE
ncbi:hypothetical protein TURU_040363 [Turdus rufiventris]|nr:hypothetical protein TURU_040363 [Turdus rufiventris]